MRPATYSASSLIRLLRRKKIATLPELKAALGTSVDRTVFRKLSELRYRASYSHGGRYYTLDELAEFDASGLWSFEPAWFSAHGSLADTAAVLVDASPAGCFVDELDARLHVKTKDCLRHLATQERLAREELRGRLLYCSPEPVRRRTQLAARQAMLGGGTSTVATVPPSIELKAKIILFLGLLNERQRRVFAGLESLKMGPGSDTAAAEALGLDPQTVARGRAELLQGTVDQTRLRRPGAGRKPVEKKRRRSSRASRSS
jgi:hypothetical protein